MRNAGLDEAQAGIKTAGRNISNLRYAGASLVAQRLKHLPPMRETQVQSLGREDPLEKEMVTHSSVLAWRSRGQRSLVGYSPQGRTESDTTERLHWIILLHS